MFKVLVLLNIFRFVCLFCFVFISITQKTFHQPETEQYLTVQTEPRKKRGSNAVGNVFIIQYTSIIIIIMDKTFNK